jgi:hypothetical protein
MVRRDKEAIFHKDGQQITNWFDRVGAYGLVDGKSDYYVLKDNEGLYVGKLGFSKLFGPFQHFGCWDNWYYHGSFFDPFSTTAMVYTVDGKEKIISKQEVEDFFKEKETEDGRTK